MHCVLFANAEYKLLFEFQFWVELSNIISDRQTERQGHSQNLSGSAPVTATSTIVNAFAFFPRTLRSGLLPSVSDIITMAIREWSTVRTINFCVQKLCTFHTASMQCKIVATLSTLFFCILCFELSLISSVQIINSLHIHIYSGDLNAQSMRNFMQLMFGRHVSEPEFPCTLRSFFLSQSHQQFSLSIFSSMSLGNCPCIFLLIRFVFYVLQHLLVLWPTQNSIHSPVNEFHLYINRRLYMANIANGEKTLCVPQLKTCEKIEIIT